MYSKHGILFRTLVKPLAWAALALTLGNANASNLQFEAIRLFEGSYATSDRTERVYRTQFDQATTRYLFVELKLANLYREQNHHFKVRAEFFYPNGQPMNTSDKSFTMYPDYPVGYFWLGAGWDNPGKWQLGVHRVRVYVNDLFVAENSFQITDGYSTQHPNYRGDDRNYYHGQSTFPSPRKIERIHSSGAVWRIENDTTHELYISYTNGGIERSVTVLPNSVSHVELSPGIVNLHGSLRASHIKTFSTELRFDAGWKYLSRFYIKRE